MWGLKHLAMALAAIVLLTGCSTKFKTYNGPEVTRVVVLKSKRQMFLLDNKQVLKGYNIELGFEPNGDKKIEGDGKTPEGLYTINRRNPDSLFHLSLGIDYPSERDIAEAKRLGKKPGGDIFIHGRGLLPRGQDWTWGCIAVSNEEMEDIYAMVQDGTPIAIYP